MDRETGSDLIRPMRPEDVDAVLSIDQASFPTTWAKESYLRDLMNSVSCYIVAEAEAQVVGCAGMWVIGDEAHLTTVAVHPQRRRRGLGRRLLEAMLRAAIARGAKKMTLEVRASNLAAKKLYEHYAFLPIAHIKHYYLDNGEDAIVMARNPLAQPEVWG